MKKELEGFVIYNKSSQTTKAYAVLSNNYEIKAICNKIPKTIKSYIVPIEDKRFYQHNGIDIIAIFRALARNTKHLKIIEGGSTISQQLARNLLKDNSKTINRKIKETLLAIEIESNFTKDEVLDLYFNNVYFGRNIIGLRAASLHYFAKEPESLSHLEILYLITILRGPNFYLAHSDITNRRLAMLVNLLFKHKSITINKLNKLNSRSLKICHNKINIVKCSVAPYITESINYKRKTITSTLVSSYQSFSDNFVKESKLPTSVIIIKNNKVVGVSSSFGYEHPFIFKSNVGSTLKPFIFYLAKKLGIDDSEEFHSNKNTLGWKVREVLPGNGSMSLKDALINSNNNVFINVAAKIGMEKTLSFLAETLDTPKDEMYMSTVLGATKSGISLFKLALAYNNFFTKNIDIEKKKLMEVLNTIFKIKLNINIKNAFLKTGTTNDNQEQLAIIQQADTTFAFLSSCEDNSRKSKEGGLIMRIKHFFKNKLKQNIKDYKWT